MWTDDEVRMLINERRNISGIYLLIIYICFGGRSTCILRDIDTCIFIEFSEERKSLNLLNLLIVIQIFKFSKIICDTIQIAPDSTHYSKKRNRSENKNPLFAYNFDKRCIFLAIISPSLVTPLVMQD
jgi:hypothetical protein